MKKRIILSKSVGDQVIEPWLKSLGFDVMPPETKLDSWISGVVIGGGADPIGQTDEERDKKELELIQKSVKERIPCLGVCRGSEIVAIWDKGKLQPMMQAELPQHVKIWHDITIDYPEIKGTMRVWSNHHLKFKSSGKLKPCAWSPDGNIEAVIDKDNKVMGVLWHPEKSGTDGPASAMPWLKWVSKR